MQNNDVERIEKFKVAIQSIHKVMNPDDKNDPVRIAYHKCLEQLIVLEGVNLEVV